MDGWMDGWVGGIESALLRMLSISSKYGYPLRAPLLAVSGGLRERRPLIGWPAAVPASD